MQVARFRSGQLFLSAGTALLMGRASWAKG